MAKQYVAKEDVPSGWLSRAKLAQASGVTRATVKHYNDLGLLPPPVFTSPNMAYYDSASVGRIRLVRDLQAKRHLPLTVIADILETQGPERVERAFQFSQALQADLLDALAGRKSQAVSRADLLAIDGISEDVLDTLERIHLIRRTNGGRGAKYDTLSVNVVQAVGVMRSIGLTEAAGFRVEDLALYRDKLQDLVGAETRLFKERVLSRVKVREGHRISGFNGVLADRCP